MKMLVKLLTVCIAALWNFSAFAISSTEMTAYPAFCKRAAADETVFEHFKSNPIYQQILEHVSFKTGREYLDVILRMDPSIASLFDKFRENDSIGNPVIYHYDRHGWFSPTTLRYIKVACDLKKQFGDLSKMHIIEIGGGYGGQCKILADLTGFASYTIIDIPDALALTGKYLSLLEIQNVHYIENKKLEEVKSYDLLISNYAFSEIDRVEQELYLKYVIGPTKNGYMTMNFGTQYLGSIPIEELVPILLSTKKKPQVQKEYPNTHPTNLIVSW
jgi:putative sugar O-methyltransferase